VETGDTRVLVDPFFSEYEARLYDSPPPDDYATGIDALLVTHEHLDHLDAGFLPALVAASPDVRVVVPEPVAPVAAELTGRAEVVPVAAGHELQLTEGVAVHVTPAWHAPAPAHGYATHGGRFVGYVLTLPSLRLYHSGDTLATPELVEELRPAQIDVAFLPINGRDVFREEREIAGNMSFREAVHLASRIGASTLVPIHWDMFAGNTELPGRAVDEAAGIDADLHVLVLRRFRPFRFVSPRDGC
jgi:L-ascorbate 6-phosphate lactonase